MTERPILKLLNDGEFHSEEFLAGASAASQSDVRKEIESLEALGCEIEYDRVNGYRFPPGIKYLEKELILQGLSQSTKEKIDSLEIHLTIDSTSSEASRKAKAGFEGCAAIVAEHQGQGRGRRGREWVSPMARNLYLTLLWPIEAKIQDLSGLSLVVGLSLVKVLQDSELNGMEGLSVKWPNDVLLNGHKLAGILLELNSLDQCSQLVSIGIGVNVNLSQEALKEIDQHVADLVSQNNPNVDRNILLANLINQLDQDLRTFAIDGLAQFQQQWQQFDHNLNRPVEIITGAEKLTGIARGIDDAGALLLETAQGVQALHGGELAPSLRSVNTNVLTETKS